MSPDAAYIGWGWILVSFCHVFVGPSTDHHVPVQANVLVKPDGVRKDTEGKRDGSDAHYCFRPSFPAYFVPTLAPPPPARDTFPLSPPSLPTHLPLSTPPSPPASRLFEVIKFLTSSGLFASTPSPIAKTIFRPKPESEPAYEAGWDFPACFTMGVTALEDMFEDWAEEFKGMRDGPWI